MALGKRQAIASVSHQGFEFALDFIESGPDAFKRYRRRSRVGMRGLFFQFEHERNVVAQKNPSCLRCGGHIGQRARRRNQRGERSLPVNGAFIGRQVFVLFAMIIVNVGGDDEIAHGVKTRQHTTREMRGELTIFRTTSN